MWVKPTFQNVAQGHIILGWPVNVPGRHILNTFLERIILEMGPFGVTTQSMNPAYNPVILDL
jgi:hypothetical protein